MSIHFIPNDPRAVAAPALRVQAKRANRPASRSGFTFVNPSPEGVFAPGTPAFLFWQCREGAIAALQAWEASAGKHTRWQGNRTRLALRQDVGDDLNAFYDRASFSFFHRDVGDSTFFSGASTDVVAHEVGHGLLDSVRPDFFSVNFLEVGAFHEAFGDCVALLTALEDLETRNKLLTVGTNILRRNFVESTAEDLSEGIRRIIPNHNAAEPRHAFNTFRYQLPQTLPGNGGPGALINEVHSFGMLFTGCFWDLIANIFGAAPAKTQATLLAAARTAGRITIAAARTASVTPRFLQSVGRAMTVADQSLNAGANRDHIRNAFTKHNILLGTNAMLAPSMVLTGNAPRGAALGASTRKDVLDRIGAPPRARLAVAASESGALQVQHAREIGLGTLDKRLKGVLALGHESVTIGSSGTRAAVLGAVPNAADTTGEVENFVRSLLQADSIDFGASAKKKAVRSVSAAADTSAAASAATHKIKTVAGKKLLVRTRFQCRCCFPLQIAG